MEGLEELEGGDADWCEAKYGLNGPTRMHLGHGR